MPRDIFRLGYSVRMQAEDGDTAEVMLYGEIVEDGPKWWKWSEEDKSASDFDKAIKEVREKGATKLLLRINSPGGVCTESVAMRAILANAGFDEINIRIEGLCASAATDIATLPGAHVAICEGSEYMIHNPWCLAIGNANELERTIVRLRNIEDTSRGFYAKKSGQSEEQIREWMDAETWFTAEQAVEYGFADELLVAEARDGTPAAACANARVVEAMRGLYRAVPDALAKAAREEEVCYEAPVAGDSTEIDHEEGTGHMDTKDISIDQLRQENPALVEEIRQSAIRAERQRQDDIDALTDPGYEDLAAQAKANGTSPEEFVRQLVAAKKQKGADFMDARRRETAPAQDIAGGAAGDNDTNENDEIKSNAESIAKYAKQYAGGSDGGMF